MSETIQIDIISGTRVYDIGRREWRVINTPLRATITAPAPGGVTSPWALAIGSAVQVHAMGTWYPGKVIAIAPKSGKLEVEYTSGAGKTRRVKVARHAVVPAGCGYPRRMDCLLAADWAAAVWERLAAADVADSKSPAAAVWDQLADSKSPIITPPRLVTGAQVRESARLVREDEARKAYRKVTISVCLPVSVTMVVKSECPISENYPLESATFEIDQVRRVETITAGARTINENMTDDDREEMDVRARQAPEYIPGVG